MTEQEFRTTVSNLLWNIANQREKVPGGVTMLFKEIYPNTSDTDIFDMTQKVMKNINEKCEKCKRSR